MYTIRFPAFLLVCSLAAWGAQAYQWPSPQYDALETLLYEGRRSDGSNLASTQHPCKNRGSTKSSIGGEWLRLAYHDVATHDAQKGTGGLDASIAFELNRTENAGAGMSSSLSDFSTYSSKYISRADVIAIGSTFAVASCGGPILRYRGGRVDALEADITGVPLPEQDLATHTAMFQRQGFTPEEMIALVACGHTLGGVRNSDHPAIVPPPTDGSADNFVTFDGTKEFDNAVVTQYLDGTTTNPLVTVANTTLASDKRIFDSDNQVTMRALAAPETFTNTCGTLLERMLNLVPSSVTLTEEITLLPAKVSTAQLTIERDQLVFKVSFRLVVPVDAKTNSNRVVTLLWCDRSGPNPNCDNLHAKSALPVQKIVDQPDSSPVTQRLNKNFNNYRFVVPINQDESISKFWFTVDEGDGSKPTTHDNGGNGYPIQQDNVLFVPGKSKVALVGLGETTQRHFDLVAAVKTSLAPSRVYMSIFDSATPNYEPPLKADLTMNLSSISPIAGYTFYTAVVEDIGAQLTIDLHADVGGTTYTEDYQPTYTLDSNIPYSPPSTVTTIDISHSSSNTKNDASSHTRTILHSIYTNFGIGLLALYIGLWIL